MSFRNELQRRYGITEKDLNSLLSDVVTSKKKLKSADLELDRHHIIPRSRNGTNDADNISMVKRHLHRKYHGLFKNKTPCEILDFIVNYFWNGRREFVEDYLKSKMHLERFEELFKRGEE